MKKLLIAALICLLPLCAYAGSENPVGEAGGYENLTPGDVVTSVTSTVRVPTSGTFAGIPAWGLLVAVEDNDINFTFDGTDPTAAAGTNIGFQAGNGDSFFLYGISNVKNFKCIDRVSGSAAVVKVTPYFRKP